MAEVVFVGVPSPIVAAALSDLAGWRVIGERMLGRSKSLCPVSRSEEQGGSSGATPGSLKESMEVRFEYGLDPRILVGSTLTRGSENVSALGLILEGTDAHTIAAVNGKALAFTWQGKQAFFTSVQHPGTTKNEFVQRAIREVILESVTL